MADYLISRVRYNKKHTHIVKVEAIADNGGRMLGGELSRIKVVILIEQGMIFIVLGHTDGESANGKNLRIEKINGVKYIKLDQDLTESDDLGVLTEY